MSKLDLKKQMGNLYSPSSREVSVVEVPDMPYLMIDGAGDPNTSKEYKEAIEALYAMAYGLKFKVKKGPRAIDYSVMPLEGLWWGGDPAAGDKASMRWTAMILQPDFITGDLFAETRGEVEKKKKLDALARMRLETLSEGRAAQILHVGPYDKESESIQKLHQLIQAQGGRPEGRHHEIYLNDPSRTAPEKLKTILRQPFV